MSLNKKTETEISFGEKVLKTKIHQNDIKIFYKFPDNK